MKSQVNKVVDTLPFDQYSRQKIVNYLIDIGIKTNFQRTKLKIIDLGGHKGQTTAFQANDSVTILDVFDEDYEGYVKGDATNMTFQDESFDIACSFDVFEHIPREKRQCFINEALRVSKYGVFIAMPIDTRKKVSAAEKLLNNFHKMMFNSDHPWLKEHIDYKIPTESEILNLIKNTESDCVSVYSNQIGDWQLMQMLIFAGARNPMVTRELDEINAWYNSHTINLDSTLDIGYRGIFFITKDKKALKGVSAAISDMRSGSSKSADMISINSQTFVRFSEAFAHISKEFTDLYTKHEFVLQKKSVLISENESLKQQIEMLQKHNNDLNNLLEIIQHSASWKVTKPIRIAKKLIKNK